MHDAPPYEEAFLGRSQPRTDLSLREVADTRSTLERALREQEHELRLEMQEQQARSH